MKQILATEYNIVDMNDLLYISLFKPIKPPAKRNIISIPCNKFGNIFYHAFLTAETSLAQNSP